MMIKKAGYLLFFLHISVQLFARQLENNFISVKYSVLYDSLFKASDWRDNLNQELEPIFGEQWKTRVLKVGNRAEKMLLGKDIISGLEYKVGDFGDKLLILDFWATWCKSCVALMPHMENLQEKFKKNIQVVFIDLWEEESNVRAFLKKRNINSNLPIIVGNKELKAAFPIQGIPYHVWIDKGGIVRLIGTPINTYPKKIQDFLEGETIGGLNDENSVPKFEISVPYYKILNNRIPKSNYYSLFTEYNPYYAAFSGGEAKSYIDSSIGKIRNTFINATVFELYRFAYSDSLKLPNIVFSPYYNNIVINFKDTLSITDEFLDFIDKTDTAFIKSRYCYEQLGDLNISVGEMKGKMQEDLNSFFESQLKIHGSIERVSLNALIINSVEESNEILRFKKSIISHAKDTFSLMGNEVIRYREKSVANAILSCINKSAVFNMLKDMRCYILDGLQGRKEDVIVVPKSGNFKDLIDLLARQGFVLKKSSYRPALLILEKD
jgi:thiol-disulfide isomerase/thioredoxin